MLFIDLEFYVPKEDRNNSKTKLRFNAAKNDNFILGGSFLDIPPYLKKIDTKMIQNFWVWDNSDFNPNNQYFQFEEFEKKLLERIYSFFSLCWNKEFKRNKTKGIEYSSLYTIGAGISRLDLPSLYIRSNRYSIASPENLFKTYLSTLPFDLTNMASITISENKYLRPVSVQKLITYLNLNYSIDSGIDVWNLYENYEYEVIKEKTTKRILINFDIYNHLKEKRDNYLVTS